MQPFNTLVSGLSFTEAPRWHKGRLYVSDFFTHRVLAIAMDGTIEIIASVPHEPSGLGWLPDGRLLVVSMHDKRILRRESNGTLVEHADLSALSPWRLNDMVVGADGRAWVGNLGFNSDANEPMGPTVLICVEPDGKAHVVNTDTYAPNGMVITPDGKTLIVGESFAARLTAFDIQPDGSLANRRVWAPLEHGTPDGICLDAEGAVWYASPVSNECVRVAEGGRVLDRVPLSMQAFACMLGGPDRRTLFISTAPDSHPERCAAARAARIETLQVAVPGAGLP
jgi:sugar lactone lactonase YvrE